jgi:hypothetical protein
MQKIREISKKGIWRVDFSCRGGFYARPGGNAVDGVDVVWTKWTGEGVITML